MLTLNLKNNFNLDMIPTLPAVAAEAIEALNSQDRSSASLAKIVGKDPAISTRVLKIANSPYYSLSRTITTLSNAIVILGEQTIKSLVLAVCLQNMHRDIGAFEKMLWEDTMIGALGSQFLAKKLSICDPDEAFIAGLLRHVGKLVLCQNTSIKSLLLMDMIKNENPKTIDLERQIFGADHAEVGAEVLRQWQFHESFIQVARHHFDANCSSLQDEQTSNMVSLVNICSQFPALFGTFGPDQEIDLGALPGAKNLKLETEALIEICDEFSQVLAENRDVFLN